ncbi:MAG: hypothetical protein EOP39_19345, partial [Rubrivivax sp.]
MLNRRALIGTGMAGAAAAALSTEAAPARAVLAPWIAAQPVTSAAPDEVAAYVLKLEFIPDLSPTTAIEPVADWHELLFLTGQVLKHDDPVALERWLDGLL